VKVNSIAMGALTTVVGATQKSGFSPAFYRQKTGKALFPKSIQRQSRKNLANEDSKS